MGQCAGTGGFGRDPVWKGSSLEGIEFGRDRVWKGSGLEGIGRDRVWKGSSLEGIEFGQISKSALREGGSDSLTFRQVLKCSPFSCFISDLSVCPFVALLKSLLLLFIYHAESAHAVFSCLN